MLFTAIFPGLPPPFQFYKDFNSTPCSLRKFDNEKFTDLITKVLNPFKPARTNRPLAAPLEAEKVVNAATVGAIANDLRNDVNHSLLPAVETSTEAAYLLSPMQQGMLFHSLHEQQSGVDIEQMVCTLHEELQVEPLLQAWQQVIERHPVLRTCFQWDSLQEPSQQVQYRVSLPITQHDWRAL